jgi:hypothetical protein
MQHDRKFSFKKALGKVDIEMTDAAYASMVSRLKDEIKQFIKALQIDQMLLPYGHGTPYLSPLNQNTIKTTHIPQLPLDIIKQETNNPQTFEKGNCNFDRDWLYEQCKRLQSSLETFKICTDVFTILRNPTTGLNY